MKKGLFVLLVCIGAMCIFSCTQKTKGWELVWEDNFDQTDSFDPASWSKIPRELSRLENNYMSDFDSCYAMRDGKLILRGLVNHNLSTDTVPFITGGVYTKDKVGFK